MAFNIYIRALKAEWIKLRHSGMIWLCLGATAFVPLIATIGYFFINPGVNGQQPDQNAWQSFIEGNFKAFTPFFFPLFLVIMITRLVYLEHRSDTWKLLETQPVKRIAIYLAKWETAVLISLICLVGLLIFTLLGGYILQLFKTKSNFDKGHIECGLILKTLCRYWVASFGIVTIQYFLGLLIKSFSWPMSIGLIAVIAGSIFSGFGILKWFPYSATGFTSFNGSQTGAFFLPHEKMSLLWAVFFFWAGFQYFRRKSFSRAFFLPSVQAVKTFVALLVFVSLFWWINRPVAVNRYHRTVFTGEISSDKPVTNIVLLQAPSYDTVLAIPVIHGRFHAELTGTIQSGIYYIRAGNYHSSLFFGTNDSVYVDWSAKERGGKIKFKGTRIAENEFLENNNDYEYNFLTNNAYQFNPGEFGRQVMDHLFDKNKKINRFKTVDNIKPADDFIKIQEALLKAKMLYLVEVVYPQTYSIYYPNSKLQYPKFIENFKKEININDSRLVSFGEYRNFVSEYLRRKRFLTDSDYFHYLDKEISSKPVKDVVLFEELQRTLAVLRDSTIRTALLLRTLPFISNSLLKRDLTETNQRMNNLQRGYKAHNFLTEALNGSEFDLQKFAGRYVIIDLWATWCGPCKKESPYFDQLAEQYASDQLAFVSVSIDEDKNAWKMDAGNKSKRVLQLWAKNPGEDFNKYYAANFIPRFILIDPKGNILNAQMPNPSDPEFEMILQKEIPLLAND